tara:strand:- start:371 stop:664 length:294 start_codon:yes stop_codon:yes gene_type:complete
MDDTEKEIEAWAKETYAFNQGIRLTVKLLDLFEQKDLIQGPAISASLSVLIQEVIKVMGNRKDTEGILKSILDKVPEPLDEIDSRDEWFNEESDKLH